MAFENFVPVHTSDIFKAASSMFFIRQLFLYISITAGLFLLIGLFRPWIMLWWEDVQNRRKVIKLYGSVAVVAYLVYWLTIFFV
jgi:hypothetical protein